MMMLEMIDDKNIINSKRQWIFPRWTTPSQKGKNQHKNASFAYEIVSWLKLKFILGRNETDVKQVFGR